MREYIEDLLVEFDEYGFAPTITMPNAEDFAKEWKRKIIHSINQLHKEMLRDCIESNIAVEDTYYKRGRIDTIREIIEKVEDMIGGKMIAQALREIYLGEE